jgi:hypothetical protein
VEREVLVNATEQISRFIANIRYEDIPTPVLNATRTIILDGVANVIAGSVQPELEYVRSGTQAKVGL